MDHYLDLDRQFIGGISLNFAVNARRSGAEAVSLVSRIGNDHGAGILERLARENVDASQVAMCPGATARQDIALAAGGERIFPPGGYRPGVLEGYVLEDAGLRFVQSHNLLASALFRQVEPLFRQVMDALPFDGWRVADFLDLSDFGYDLEVIEQFHEKLTLAFVSGDLQLAERLRPLSRATRCLIVVTLGAAGSVALIDGEPLIHTPPDVVRAIDSTGCGDAFQAAFTVAYWRNGDARKALECGTKQAALVLQHYGAIG